MAATETPKALGPCPTDEDLAAFLDGMLPAAERARITAHLADCETCYETFAGAVRFQQEASGMRGRDRTVLPFPFRKIEPHVRPLQWVGYAAAAVLVVGVGFAGYRVFLAEPTMVVADLVRPLAGRPGLMDKLDHPIFRGPQDGGGYLMGPPAFMVGVSLVDLQLYLELGQAKRAADILREMNGYLQQIPFGDENAQQCFKDAAALEGVGSVRINPQLVKAMLLRGIARAWRSKESELDETLPSTFGFGKWSEAGRLAAAIRTPGFFESRNNRRFLHKLLKDRTEIEEGTVSSLRDIGAVWDRDPFQEADYEAIAANFEQIINVYRQLASDSEP